MRKSQEMEEFKLAAVNLKKLENKIHTREDNHKKYLNRVVSEAKMRNTMMVDKVTRWKEEIDRKEKEDEHVIKLHEEQIKKKMMKMYKSA